MLAETREFFAHLIDRDLSVNNLINSDFTFLNRKLAEHYGIEGVEGEAMRKVKLEPNRVRGGILTHASIAKVTANGTVTTPVKRGNFVLTNLLGTLVNPPPPGVGSIEPDTRGATTIRESLEKHQSVEACAACHRRIDPPDLHWSVSTLSATIALATATAKASNEPPASDDCEPCTSTTTWDRR